MRRLAAYPHAKLSGYLQSRCRGSRIGALDGRVIDQHIRGGPYARGPDVRGILRAVEARPDEWMPEEWQMLERIDWEREQFRFPGIDAFDVSVREPGQAHAN
jgi:hypothetical protein